ncbi:NAD(P)-binding protein [Annulohypoxylon maeteangense]|uniref:NAD(P)-binding protein n=1 Tax=Annulohypoxylon maeteangense TaxID=1927788 RepID=UPI002007A6F7|nr:NAD(P)-binding protein [Annulohypoxylon maeteangense]KAI0889153.1 NAD(P)-binding protein [Annulohypoxylon maeteangense]
MSLCPRLARTAFRRNCPSILQTSRPRTHQPLRPATSINPTLTYHRSLHDSPVSSTKPTNPDPRENPAHALAPNADVNVGQRRLADFDLKGRVFVVTGAARGLGLALAESLVEAGGKVYCLDREDKPDEHWAEARKRVIPEWGGSLHYCQQDVLDTCDLDRVITEIADDNRRLDGVIAAAGVQQVTPAVDYEPADAARMLAINFTGVLMTATSAARQMIKYKCHGSICLIASMSGTVANKGLLSSVYNSSKAALIQLARNLAMEWSPIKPDGTGGIRVNCISPGHILTPMVAQNFEEVPGLKEKWESENMMGRLAQTTEFKGAALFLLSNASSFMTGSNLVIDGGHSSW